MDWDWFRRSRRLRAYRLGFLGLNWRVPIYRMAGEGYPGKTAIRTLAEMSKP